MNLLVYKRVLLAFAFGCLIGTLQVRLAAAAPTAQVSEAKEYYDKATAAFALGSYPEAATNYEKAFSLKPDPALLYNAAQAHRLAGNNKRALELYKSYLRVFPQGAAREEATKHADTLSQEKPAPVSQAPVASAPLDPGPAKAELPAVSAPTSPSSSDLQLSTAPVVEPEPSTSLLASPVFWIVTGVLVVGAAVVIGVAASGDKDPSASLGRIGGSN